MADNCSRLVCAGSLRRGKEMVGDIELVYISDTREEQTDLFETSTVATVDDVLAALLAEGVITKRPNTNGATMWGAKNKFAVHVESGIPVDFFATTEAAWFNYLVCRTGGADTNTRIAAAARERGWQWNPYGSGFTAPSGAIVRANSEQEVFALAGLPYLEPHQRQ